MPAVGELVRSTTGEWIVRPPERCLRGHLLGPHRALVGHQPCGCGRRGGHMTWRCRLCDAVVYAPPPAPDCRPLAGARRGAIRALAIRRQVYSPSARRASVENPKYRCASPAIEITTASL